ncbi:MAG: hypothetical protein R2880_02845 [Deinococcales bacterium]
MISPEWLSLAEHDNKRVFLENAHKLIAIGYRKALVKIKSGVKNEETDITGFIAEAIDDWLISDEAKGFNGFAVLEDSYEVSKDIEKTGRKRMRSDLTITYTNIPRSRFVCEAKRLKIGKGTTYVGNEGMGCFINGSYASNYSEVAMLGYVESKSVNKWKEIIWHEIDRNKEKLKLIASQQNIAIISDFPDEWESNHSRETLDNPVKILHILLDCQGIA